MRRHEVPLVFVLLFGVLLITAAVILVNLLRKNYLEAGRASSRKRGFEVVLKIDGTTRNIGKSSM
jgi:hypothetical protein